MTFKQMGVTQVEQMTH